MLDNAVIAAINGVHDAFLHLNQDDGLDLPQIAVLGSQSSGKSSVLETIVGNEFLPRGSGIVTRCPLLLKLVRSDEPFGEFSHKRGRMCRFSDIRDEIARQTNVLAGPSGTSPQHISLTVGAPHIVPLTLVDLPGIVAQAVEGQSPDMPARIEAMVSKIISAPNTLILFVLEANHDIATNLALRLLRKVDPEGARTVGVLTKMDLVPPGEDAMNIITGKVGKLRHGYVPVVNRSQAQSSLTLRQAVSKERDFFAQHPVYSPIAAQCGSEYLAKYLSKLLLNHIQGQLPRLEATLDGLGKRAQQQLNALGGPEMGGDCRSQVLRLIGMFDEHLGKLLDGNVAEGTDLVGGARLHHIFTDGFGKFVTSRQVADLSDDAIRTKLRNAAGMQSPLFPSDQVVRSLAAEQLCRLEEPSLQCITAIHQEMRSIIRASGTDLQRFPQFYETAMRICDEQLDSHIPTVITHVKVFIEAEGAFATVVHPPGPTQPQGAPQTSQHAQGAARTRPSPQATESNGRVDAPRFMAAAADVDDMLRQIRLIVEETFRSSQRMVAEHVPKLIGLLLVGRFRKTIHPCLIRALYDLEGLEALMAESPDVLRQRKAAESILDAVTKGRASLREVRSR